MKIEFIKRGAATRLILIFAGWSTDARYYSDCVFDGWDTAVVSDYRDMSLPVVPPQYRTVYVFAYSLGVAAASLCGIPAAASIAICGSPYPASDAYGIPEAVYQGTLDGLDERQLMKFHLRMSGDKATYEAIREKLPLNPDIQRLKDELAEIRNATGHRNGEDFSAAFDRVYLAEADRIFPYSNLDSYWAENTEAEIVRLQRPHAVDIASRVSACLPDSSAIGDGFARASSTYNASAVIQKEVCLRIGEILRRELGSGPREIGSLLEIGVGGGLLTDIWRQILTPESATYIDLFEMPRFGIAPGERYVMSDAEQWLQSTEEKFDVILSASTIQWFADPVGFLTVVRDHLNPGGLAVVSTFVKGNLHQLDVLRPCPIIYRTAGDYAASPAEIADAWERTLTFPSPRETMMHLRLTGVSPRRKKTPAAATGSSAEGKHGSLAGIPLALTYRPLILFIRG